MASAHAATLVGTPSINFGTATYKSGGKGLITITVKTNPNSAINTVTTSGSGYIYNWQGNYEEIPVQFSGMNKKTNKYLYFRLQGTDYEISTPGCGKIELSNVGLDNYGNQYKRYNIKNATSLTQAENGIFLGAEMTLTQFTGTGTCTIFGQIPFEYEETPGTASHYITAYMNVSFTIQTSVSFTHDTGAALNFGTFCASNSTTQTFTVPPTGTPSQDPSMVCPLSNDVSADSFTINSDNAMNFSVTLPGTASLTSNGNTLQVTNINSSCDSGCSVGAGGSTSFTVGGTLTVPAGRIHGVI